MAGLRDRLREATGPQHEALEGLLRLDDPDVTLERHREVLAMFRRFHAGWEPRVAAMIGDEAFLAPRRRLDRLDADLAELGVDPATLPTLPPPDLAGRGEAMGSLYVMEGSTLGGRLILRNLDRLGLPGRRYFAGHGEATGAMWRGFLERLEAEPDADGVVRGAVATFAALRDAMAGRRAAA